MYQDAWDENRIEDAENYSTEVGRVISDLSDNLEETHLL
jgi:hypothetical protein